MRSAEIRKAGETALQRRLRHEQTVAHLKMELIMYCGEDKAEARSIGRRVVAGVEWMYLDKHNSGGGNLRQSLRERQITAQLVAHLTANAAGLEDAREIAQGLLRAIAEVWGEEGQRDLRVVC